MNNHKPVTNNNFINYFLFVVIILFCAAGIFASHKYAKSISGRYKTLTTAVKQDHPPSKQDKNLWGESNIPEVDRLPFHQGFYQLHIDLRDMFTAAKESRAQLAGGEAPVSETVARIEEIADISFSNIEKLGNLLIRLEKMVYKAGSGVDSEHLKKVFLDVYEILDFEVKRFNKLCIAVLLGPSAVDEEVLRVMPINSEDLFMSLQSYKN